MKNNTTNNRHLDPLEAFSGERVRAELGGMSEQTLQRLMDRGKFPQPIRMTKQGKVWFRRDVEAFLWIRAVKCRLTIRRRPTPSGTKRSQAKSSPKTT